MIWLAGCSLVIVVTGGEGIELTPSVGAADE